MPLLHGPATLELLGADAYLRSLAASLPAGRTTDRIPLLMSGQRCQKRKKSQRFGLPALVLK